MESPMAVGGHGVGLTLQGSGGRKEWRVVNEISGRERIVGDSSGNQARLSAGGRPRSNSGASRRTSRNGQMFHTSGSGHSSDSDLHGGDVGSVHLMGASVAPEELMPQGIGHRDEAVLYQEMHRAQQRNEHLDSALSSMSMDSGLNSMENPDEAMQKRLHEVSRQREQLQQAELELKAQFIARAEVIRMQNGLDEQVKQHSDIVSSLQGQIQEREQQIRHLEQQLEERERQLHVNQIETNEAVWAKDGLLREQTNELATLRRDRDNAVTEHQAAAAQFDAERAEHMAQIENLKEQVREKDRQLQEAEEQSRNTQDVILYKDEQLRDAQAWMARAQELDAYHVNTNNTLHAELRDRTDQMNQLWGGYQRQLADLERYHAQAIQRLQQEVNEGREQIRVLKGAASADSKEETSSGTDGKQGGHLEANDDAGIKGNRILMAVSPSLNRVKPNVIGNGIVVSNGAMEGLLPVLLPREGLPPKAEHATGLAGVAPLLGITTVLPPSGPTTAIHQFGMHQQGMPPTLQPSPLQAPQPPLTQLQPLPTVLAPQQHLPPLQHQQGALGMQVLHHHHHHVQQHQSPSLHRLSQRPQPLPLQQPSQPPQTQHLHQAINLQSQGQQTRHQDIQQQQEQTALEHAVTQAEQQTQNNLLPQSSHLQPPQHSHNQALHQQQQQQLSSQLLHQQGPQTLSVPISEQKDIPLVPQQSPQDEPQVLPVDLQQQHESGAEQPEQELTVPHRQQNNQQDRQPHEQRRRLDPRLQQFSHQQPNQPQSQGYQLLQLENSVESQPQQLQHQQGLSSNMGHLGGGSHASPIQEETSSGHVPHEVSVSKATSDSQKLTKSSAAIPKQHVIGEASSKAAEPVLLDERSLLACLVRAVPAEPSARIRISSTLPNRLGKMLAPLHWHDYRKRYGRLDDFVGSHPELFVIEGDFINLQEGAHATFAATTAVAKAAAAAAAVAPAGPARMPTVAVTPVAHSQLQRGKSLKGSSNSQKESKGASVTAPEAVSQPPSSSPQPGNSRPIQSPTANRNVVENGSGNLHHVNVNPVSTVKNGGKVEGAISRSNGMSSTTGKDTSVHFENGGVNGYRNSGRGSGYYGNRQQGRGPLPGSGQYRKQENHIRPHTQEGRIAGPASTSAQ